MTHGSAPDASALKEMIDEAGLSFRQNSVSWILKCPRCLKKDKLYIRKRDGRFVCWYCASVDGYQGRPEFALKDLLPLPLKEICRRLYGSGVTHSHEFSVRLPLLVDFFDEFDTIPDLLKPLPHMPFPLDFLRIDEDGSEKGVAYLQGRGVDLETAVRLGFMYHPATLRVVFPVAVNGVVVGWQARLIEQDHGIDATGRLWSVPKILTPKGFDRGRAMMFQDSLTGSDHAIITEGPMDAIKASVCGGAVATMGKFMSEEQVRIVRAAGVKRVYLGQDPDAAGEVTRLCRLFHGLDIYRLLPSVGRKDLGAMSKVEVLGAFRSAQKITTGNVFLPPLSDRLTVQREVAAGA